MHRVETNAELGALHAAGAGFIFNDFTSTPGVAQNVLHLAGCVWVGRMLDRAEPRSKPSVRKMFFVTIDEARLWIVANRGPEGHGWKRCATCLRGESAGGEFPSRPARVQLATSRSADGEQSPALLSDAAASAWPAYTAFARPGSLPLRLPVAPRLASWNKAGDLDQVGLGEYLATADELLRPHCEQLSGPRALRLDVGLPRTASLLDQRDLDNYLLPLATRLSRSTGGGFACVWGTKQHAGSSFVRVEQATPMFGAQLFDCCYEVRTSASSRSHAFKEQIRDQLASVAALPPGPVRMQISFTVGPGRNWINLWKPTIDALGQILGNATTADRWAPLDGRIVDLGLHRRVVPAIGNDVVIVIAAGHIDR